MLKAEGLFFFEQNNPKRFQTRRARKFDDTYSNLEGITFRPGERDAEVDVVLSTGVVPGPGVTAGNITGGSVRLRATGATSNNCYRASVAIHGIHFPSVDPYGPNLVSGNRTTCGELGNIKTTTNFSEKKIEFLQEVEKEQSSKREVKNLGSIWRVSEAKFASTGILSKLGKVLDVVCEENIEVTLPVDLVSNLSLDYEQLSFDVTVEKREWQTDCYYDCRFSITNPFLTDNPDKSVQKSGHSSIEPVVVEEESRQVFTGGGASLSQRDSHKQVGKKVRMNMEKKGEGARVGMKSSPERPHTARSNFSYMSSLSEDVCDSCLTTDYDRLPAELCPTILHYQRESMSLKMRGAAATSTRMDKVQAQRKKHEMEQIKKSRQKGSHAQHGGCKRPASALRQRPMSAKPLPANRSFGNFGIPKTTITFSISTLMNDDKQAWLVHPSDVVDPEAHTLRLWDKKLKELHRKRAESQFLDRKRGADRKLVVKFYNDPQVRILRTKHQRSFTVPHPTLLSKLLLSGGILSPGGVDNTVLMNGEGMRTFVLTLPDGSGYCKYFSGRQAVCLSRCDRDGPLRRNKGFYSLIFDDCERSPLLAYFTPLGSGCCYHKNGSIRMLSDRSGGCLYNESGELTRKWEWPPLKTTMPVSVNFHLNVHLSLHCSSLTSIELRVSMRGQAYKFALGPTAEDLLDRPTNEDLTVGSMLSTMPFISQAAQSRVRKASIVSKESSPPVLDVSKGARSSTKGLRNITGANSALSGDESGSVIHPLSNLLEEGDKFIEKLGCLRKSAQEVVDKWMRHYCTTVGISKPSASRLRTASKSGLCAEKGMPSQVRLVKSSLGYTADFIPTTWCAGVARPSSRLQHTRSKTHPLNSRASSCQISPTIMASLKLFTPALGGMAEGEIAATPKISTNRSSLQLTSPQNRVVNLTMESSSGKSSCQMKGDEKSAVSKTMLRGVAVGCPFALHRMIVEHLESMPACKCDKRHAPFISDLELDCFLASHVPAEQLVVIYIKSSLKEDTFSCEPLVDSIYCHQNRVRFSPCLQSVKDSFRLLKYDLAQARLIPYLDTPLLVQRHNASAGMFLMYMRGHLVYAGYVFNGYSNSRRDFMKEAESCIRRGEKGQFLPSDFRFTRQKGSRILRSHTWAYPISGVMHNLIPVSPEFSSRTAKVEKMGRKDEGEEEQEEDSVENSQAMFSHPKALVGKIFSSGCGLSKTDMFG